MPRKAIDSRIPALIRNGIQEKKRTFFVVVGDRAKDVIVHLHYIMSSVDVKQNKSVLWAYKKDLLGFTSHRKKREAKIRKEIKRGIRDVNSEDPFELFVTLNNIRYVYYKETEKILGNTYGMCILQDFEAITPNLLARTIETVEGGGLVLLLFKGMKSLKQLYTMSMDVHSRYRTEAHDDVMARFNERFILSLGGCEACLVVDDELNVLPISGGKNVQQLPAQSDDSGGEPDPKSRELKEIKESLADSKPVGPLLALSKTVDQAKALLTFVDAISEKTLRNTVTLTAARGRGKSAALGFAVAAAVAHGYSNIFITAPSPENLKTFFEFVVKGFDALEYTDHVDYTILQSTNPDYNKAIVRINVYRQHRQTIQYIQPQDAHVLGQAELVVIDEAAAIPLPLVRKLMGPYLVFMASTINGYEGTGRSLSLKLIQQLRDQAKGLPTVNGGSGSSIASKPSDKAMNDDTFVSSGRSLREITLLEPIRYAAGDLVEKWLNKLLCLDATLPKSKMNTQGTPHPSTCELVHVNRDTLFSFHPVSEKFLQQMMALYVASHYKNSPNDLQLMSDAPAHQLFVLIPPIKEDASTLPEPLCVIQVALEGRISKHSVMNSLSRGQRAGGDLIPWLVSQQFQDSEFAGLSGSRIVRIATNPEYLKMGYGSRALELLVDFYEGKFASLSEDDATIENTEHMIRVTDAELEQSTLLDDNVHVRNINSMPPLFSRLSERTPDRLDYLGVSYGLTQQLHKFWKRAAFAPVYLRQTPNDLTGEHSCVMLRPLKSGTSTNTESSWLAAYSSDFHKRFLNLLSYQFRAFPAIQSLSISESASRPSQQRSQTQNGVPSAFDAEPLTRPELNKLFSPFDLARLDSYANNMLDYHVILDLIPRIAHLYFEGKLKSAPCQVSLSGVQQSILLAIGLQRKDLSDVEKELDVPSNQLLAMFIKIVRKVATVFRSTIEGAIESELPTKQDAESAVAAAIAKNSIDSSASRVANVISAFNGAAGSLSKDDMNANDDRDADSALREKQRAMIDALPLEKYELTTSDLNGMTGDNTKTNNGDDHDARWAEAERQILQSMSKGDTSTVVSVKSGKRKALAAEAEDMEVHDEQDKNSTTAKKKHKKDKEKRGKHDRDRGDKEKRKHKAKKTES